jgi:hypothetical protein
MRSGFSRTIGGELNLLSLFESSLTPRSSNPNNVISKLKNGAGKLVNK